MNSGRPSKKDLSYEMAGYGECLLHEQTPPLKSLKIHEASVDSVLIHRHSLLSGSHDRTVLKTDMNKFKVLSTYEGHTSGIWAMDVSHKGNLLVSGGSDGALFFWDLRGNKPVGSLTIERPIYSVSMDDQSVLVGGGSGWLGQVDLRKQEVIRGGAETATGVQLNTQISQRYGIAAVADIQGELTVYSLDNLSPVVATDYDWGYENRVMVLLYS